MNLRKAISIFSSRLMQSVFFISLILSPLLLSAQQAKTLVPNLRVRKTVDKEQVEPGDTLNYTIWYTNALNDTAYNVVLADHLPGKTVFLSSLNPSWHINTGSDTLFYSIGTVAPGDSGLIGLHLLVAGQAEFTPGQHNILNVVEIRGTYHSILYSNKHAAISSLFLIPDLEIKKSHLPRFLSTYPGSQLTYNIVVKNYGNIAATNVVVSDTLSRFLSAFGAQPYPITKDAIAAAPDTVVRIVIPSIEPKDSVILHIHTKLTRLDLLGLDMILNRAGVKISDELNLDNNFTKDTTYFVYGGGGSLWRDYLVEKTDDRDSVLPGGKLTYTIRYKNRGNMYTLDLKLTDYFPVFASLTNIEFSDPGHIRSQNPISSRDGMEFYFNLLAPNDSGTITLHFDIADTMSVGSYVLIDTVKIESFASMDIDSNNNISIDRTNLVAIRDLEISKTDHADSTNPGDQLVYEIAYKNIGNLPARGFVIKEYFPVFTKFENFGFSESNHLNSNERVHDPEGIKWFLNDLSPGAEGLITLMLTVDDSIPLGNYTLLDSISIASETDDEINLENNYATDSTTLATIRDLEVVKIASRDTIAPGEMVNYTIRVRNRGNMPAHNIVLRDSLGDKENIAAIDTNGVNIPVNNAEIIWHFGILPAGSMDYVYLNIRTKDFSELKQVRIHNYVSISAADSEATYLNNADTTTTIVFFQPQLQLKIFHSQNALNPGDQFQYLLKFRNTGTAMANNVVLHDTLPKYVHFNGRVTDFPDTNKWETLPSGNSELDDVIKFKLGNLNPKMTQWQGINVFVEMDSILPGVPTLFLNKGQLADSDGFYAFARDSLIAEGEQFSATVEIIPEIDLQQSEKSLYLGSLYNLKVSVNKPLMAGTILIYYSEPNANLTMNVPIQSINQNVVDGHFIYQTPNPMKVPDNAGYGRMTVTADVTSTFDENQQPLDTAYILRPPEEFKLNKNAVNLNLGEVVTARFTLSKPEQATISIYTVAGELVRKLYDAKLSIAGEDQVEWDGKNEKGKLVASGVYLLYLKTPSFEKVKKVIIVR